MSDKSTILRAFNTHFFDFIDDIIKIFPEQSDIKYAKNSFMLIKQANPTAIIKVWYQYIYIKYKDVIDEGNISFFFEKDYVDDVSYLSNSNEILTIIDTIRNPIRNMSDVNREHSRKYIQNLSKLSELYNNFI